MNKLNYNLDIEEIFKFLLTGIIAVLIDAIVYFFLYFNLEFHAEISKRISFISGALFIFIVNRSFVFRIKKKNIYQVLLFSTLYLISFFANSYSHDYIYYNFYNIWFAFIIATIVSTIINYLGQKYVVFKS